MPCALEVPVNPFNKPNSNFRRKLKYFLIAASAVFVLFVAGIVWVGYQIVEYASTVRVSPTVSVVSNSNCWVKAQALMSTEAFLAVPIAQQIASIRKACFEEPLGAAGLPANGAPAADEDAKTDVDKSERKPEW